MKVNVEFVDAVTKVCPHPMPFPVMADWLDENGYSDAAQCLRGIG